MCPQLLHITEWAAEVPHPHPHLMAPPRLPGRPDPVSVCLAAQRASADPGRRAAPLPAAAAAAATGAGAPPATSPTRPRRRRRCPPTAPSLSAALRRTTASMRPRPATCCLTSPSPGKERSASAPSSWSLTVQSRVRVTIRGRAWLGRCLHAREPPPHPPLVSWGPGVRGARAFTWGGSYHSGLQAWFGP